MNSLLRALALCLIFVCPALTTQSQLAFHPQLAISLRDDLEFAVDRPANAESGPQLPIQSRIETIHRPKSPIAYQEARLQSLRSSNGSSLEVLWDEVQVSAPDLAHRHTVVQLARMANNAYALPGMPRWAEIDEIWNTSFPFGWEDDADGFRGHIFATPDNSTVVLAIKGTTAISGPTTVKDKINDNLLFSCCCAAVDPTWIFRTVCTCHCFGYRCDAGCLSKALSEDSLFYSVGVNLIDEVNAMYPNSSIWLVGHSLGGALASLLGTTFGLPAVAFESPGERMAAQRLGLPMPPSHDSSSDFALAPVTHIYHNADPIPQGTCTGPFSACAQLGYALETRCHLGTSIVYDVVGELGWRVDVRRHPILAVIRQVLELDRLWGGREVPRAMKEVDCVDCYKWDFGYFNATPIEN